MSRDSLTVSAPAKVNLTLEILGKRPDGYHDIASVIQAVDLADTVTLTLADRLTFSCDVAELDNESNLALRAAQLLNQEADVKSGAKIDLRKRIPEAAGLGGGSSDAAAVLRGLNALWNLGLTFDELQGLAARLGSDVPFFILGGAALVEGLGEKLTSLPPLPGQWLTIMAPGFHIEDKTATMYSMLSNSHYSSGEATHQLADLLRRGEKAYSSNLRNAFEQVVDEIFPGLKGYRDRFREAGAASVHLSGSGPCLYTFVEREAEGRGIQEALSADGIDAFVARTVGPNPPIGFPAEDTQS